MITVVGNHRNVEDDTSEIKNKPLDDKAEGATKSSSEIDGDREND